MLPWLGAGVVTTSERAGALDGEAVGTLAQTSGDIGGMVVAAVALVALGLAGMAVWRADLSAVLSRSENGDTRDGPASAESPAEPEPASDPEAAEQTEPEGPTDQERVVRILDTNDGRMKQARIVDETGWSKSKVSMLLSEMEDDEEISKLRVGRENIISLSGNEPEAAGSPFDDE